MLKVVEKEGERKASGQLMDLDEIARAGARRMLMAALEAEATGYVERHRGQRNEQGRALVVRKRPGPGAHADVGRREGGAYGAAGQ